MKVDSLLSLANRPGDGVPDREGKRRRRSGCYMCMLKASSGDLSRADSQPFEAMVVWLGLDGLETRSSLFFVQRPIIHMWYVLLLFTVAV